MKEQVESEKEGRKPPLSVTLFSLCPQVHNVIWCLVFVFFLLELVLSNHYCQL